HPACPPRFVMTSPLPGHVTSVYPALHPGAVATLPPTRSSPRRPNRSRQFHRLRRPSAILSLPNRLEVPPASPCPIGFYEVIPDEKTGGEPEAATCYRRMRGVIMYLVAGVSGRTPPAGSSHKETAVMTRRAIRIGLGLLLLMTSWLMGHTGS